MLDRCSDDDCVAWWAFHLLDPCCGKFSYWWFILILGVFLCLSKIESWRGEFLLKLDDGRLHCVCGRMQTWGVRWGIYDTGEHLYHSVAFFSFLLILSSWDHHKTVVNVCLCYKNQRPLSSISGEQLVKFLGKDTPCISSLSTLQQYNCIIILLQERNGSWCLRSFLDIVCSLWDLRLVAWSEFTLFGVLFKIKSCSPRFCRRDRFRSFRMSLTIEFY